MEVRIGIKNTPKELEIDLPNETKREEVVKLIEGTLAKEGNVLWLTDKRGRTVGIPGKKLAYVEIGSGTEDRKVGFTT